MNDRKRRQRAGSGRTGQKQGGGGEARTGAVPGVLIERAMQRLQALMGPLASHACRICPMPDCHRFLPLRAVLQCDDTRNIHREPPGSSSTPSRCPAFAQPANSPTCAPPSAYEPANTRPSRQVSRVPAALAAPRPCPRRRRHRLPQPVQLRPPSWEPQPAGQIHPTAR